MRLGEWLEANHRITPAQLAEALNLQSASPGQRLGACLRSLGAASETDVLEALAAQYHCRLVASVPESWLDRSLVADLPVDFLRNRCLLPVRSPEGLCLLTNDPAVVVQHSELSLLLGQDLQY